LGLRALAGADVIREEYVLTSWRRWAPLVADAVRRFAARHGPPDLLILSPVMHRRMSVAASRDAGRYAPLRGVGTVDGVLPVVVEDDAEDGVFALVKVESEPSDLRAA
jgi:hypothetical protein